MSLEQDHRRIKQRIRPMLGFKRFDSAAVTITGIELAQKIKKHQFKIGKLSGDQELLPRFGQLFSLPEIFGRLRNADRITQSGFAPEPKVSRSSKPARS